MLQFKRKRLPALWPVSAPGGGLRARSVTTTISSSVVSGGIRHAHLTRLLRARPIRLVKGHLLHRWFPGPWPQVACKYNVVPLALAHVDLYGSWVVPFTEEDVDMASAVGDNWAPT
ncbi:hypothetical protein DFQ26_001110, partial [Actinomortierella ambigua]